MSTSENVENPSCRTTPLEGWIKANWDASLVLNEGRMGVGIVLRDHRERVIAAWSQTRVGAPEPSSA
jgi:hypothetical protein